MVMRVLVEGTPGLPNRTGVRFRTNDPERSEMAIEASVSKVKAGVTTLPTSVMFGNLQMGTVARQVLNVFDSAKTPRTIERVSPRHPDRVAVRILTSTGDRALPHDPKLGVQIGRLEFVATTQIPGPLTDEIEIHLRGERRPTTVIEVSGQVTGPVEVVPSVIVLPRASDSGPIYFGECVCRSTTGKLFTLTADSPPAGLSVRIDHSIASSSQVVRIEWDPAKDVEFPASGLPKVRFRASIEGRETILEVGVMCRPKGEL